MKKVSFGAKRPSTTIGSSIDDWVNHRTTETQEPQPKVKMKRLTIDVAADLHRRIRSQCVIQGLVMADEIRSLLEVRFPAEPKPGQGGQSGTGRQVS